MVHLLFIYIAGIEEEELFKDLRLRELMQEGGGRVSLVALSMGQVLYKVLKQSKFVLVFLLPRPPLRVLLLRERKA